jgi:hypothetical protein
MDGIYEHALDGALREGRVVVGDVLAEIVEREFLVNLRRAVGLGLGDVLFLRAGLCADDHDTVVNHFLFGFRLNIMFEVCNRRTRNWPLSGVIFVFFSAKVRRFFEV